MKITCNACGSNYAIADEKVSGRLVKVRCKSCGAAIVVDARVQAPAATAGAAPPSAPAPAVQEPAAGLAADVSAETWSVNLSENDSRTMTLAEIITAHGLGQLADAYVWKDGMDDWAPLMSVPELAAAVAAAPSAPVAPAPSPTRTAESSPHPDGEGAARAAAGTAATRAAATRPKQTPDLFGGVAQAGSEEDALRAPPPEEEHQRPVGARNENSVLFSLDALRAGVTATAPAAAAGRPGPRAPGRAEVGARAPAASDDPFGLGGAAPIPAFDPSANLALMNAPPPPEPKPEPRRPRVVEAAAVDGVVAAGPSKRTLLLAVGGTAIVMLAIMGVVLAIVLGRDAGEAVAQATSASAAAAEGTKPAAATVTDTATSAPVADATEPATDSGTGTATETGAAEPAKPLTPEEKKKLEEALAQKRAEDAKRKAEADAATAEAKKKEAEKKEAAAVASGFDKGAASAALSSAASAATSCKRPDGPTGTGKVLVTFAPSGRVTTANVTGGGFGGTSVGGCVASVFRSARVPAFQGSPVTVSKSFTIP